MEQFPGWLVFEAHRLLYHSTLGPRVIKEKAKQVEGATTAGTPSPRVASPESYITKFTGIRRKLSLEIRAGKAPAAAKLISQNVFINQF